MELRQLRYLEAVIRHRHFSRAADELHVAQSAVSHQVRLLERELGTQLLRRTTRSVEPADAGALVATRAREVLAQLDSLRDELDDLEGLVRGRLAVGAMLFGGRLDIPALLAQFSATYPQVEVAIREGTARRMTELLDAGRLDLAFALEVTRPPSLDGIALSTEELVAVMSTEHPLRGTAPLAMSALADQPLIAFEHGSSTRALIDAAMLEARIQPRIASTSTDLAFMRSLVASGLGVAILPRSLASRPGPPVSFRPLKPRRRMTVALWWLRGRRLSAPARAFVEFVSAERRGGRRARYAAIGSASDS